MIKQLIKEALDLIILVLKKTYDLEFIEERMQKDCCISLDYLWKHAQKHIFLQFSSLEQRHKTRCRVQIFSEMQLNLKMNYRYMQNSQTSIMTKFMLFFCMLNQRMQRLKVQRFNSHFTTRLLRFYHS